MIRPPGAGRPAIRPGGRSVRPTSFREEVEDEEEGSEEEEEEEEDVDGEYSRGSRSEFILIIFSVMKLSPSFPRFFL
jgi:hypothetical protein